MSHDIFLIKEFNGRTTIFQANLVPETGFFTMYNACVAFYTEEPDLSLELTMWGMKKARFNTEQIRLIIDEENIPAPVLEKYKELLKELKK